MKALKAIALTTVGVAASAEVAQGAADWVERSNAHAMVVLEVLAKFNPEQAAAIGVEGYDESVVDLAARLHERSQAATREATAELRRRLADEKDAKVRQDLEILIEATDNAWHSADLQQRYMLPYFNVGQTLFQGIRALLDPQIPAERQAAALVRLRKYSGLESGYEPITLQARARTTERFGVDGLIGPYRAEVEQDLERSQAFVEGIAQLFEGSGIEGWREPYDRLLAQVEEYNSWVRSAVLPRARDDYRVPPEIYSDALKNWGVDASPEQLIEDATRAFVEIRNEMMTLAPLVAAQRGYETDDYRVVIRRLKDEQIDGDQLLEFYHEILAKLEDIIRRQQLVTLPARDAGIRIGSEAETAAQPAPHLDVPRLIGNTGEHPAFVLPKLGRNEDGSWQQTDDTFEANTWTLTAHEARPGHELQFSAMIEEGVSIARAVFAFNSANVEGWALYAEAIAKPYMPLDGQLISLQYRLARAARMFLDPMLNLGLTTPQEAKKLLLEEVVLGETWAQNEIERYTYRIPGQATAYFYGYAKLQALRAQTELNLGERFDARAFHDFVLAQGLLPPQLLRKAVNEEFVPAQSAGNASRVAR